MIIKTHLDDVGTMLRKRGLEANGRVQRIFTQTVAKELDPFVPMQTGILKNTRIIGVDSITYNGPYARFHYHGKLMVGIITHSAWAKSGERKILTETDLVHHGAPKRGPYWDVRMWPERSRVILNVVARAAGGTPE